MKNSTFTKDFWRYLIVFIIIIGIICFFPYWFTQRGTMDFKGTGEIGDTIGGIMSPFVAIAASVLTFLAFWVQYKANEQQRKDIALERFESNLFELIHIQQDITNNLTAELTNKKGKQEIHGRSVFYELYSNAFMDDLGIGPSAGVKGAIIINGYQSYTKFYELEYLDHYFRSLYRVIKYIDDSKHINRDKKYEYTSIVRANLSKYELLILFYNCLSENGKDKFKPLIEKYAIFNNIRTELLTFPNEQAIYPTKFQESYPFILDENRDMNEEYKKGAFVYLNIKEEEILQLEIKTGIFSDNKFSEIKKLES